MEESVAANVSSRDVYAKMPKRSNGCKEGRTDWLDEDP